MLDAFKRYGRKRVPHSIHRYTSAPDEKRQRFCGINDGSFPLHIIVASATDELHARPFALPRFAHRSVELEKLNRIEISSQKAPTRHLRSNQTSSFANDVYYVFRKR